MARPYFFPAHFAPLVEHEKKIPTIPKQENKKFTSAKQIYTWTNQ